MTSKRGKKQDAPAVEESGNGYRSDHERLTAQREAVAAELVEMKRVNSLIRDAINARQKPEDVLEAAGYTPMQIIDLMEPVTGSDGRQYGGYPLNEVNAKERFLQLIDKMLPKVANGNGHAAKVESERQQGGEAQIG